MAVAPSATAVRRRSLFRPFDVPADHRLTVVATRLRHCERAMASRVDASKVPRAPAPATAYAAPGPFAAGFRKFSAVVRTCLRASPKIPCRVGQPAESRPHHQRALPRGRGRRVVPALSIALRRAPPPGTCEGYLWLLRIAAGIFVPHVIRPFDLPRNNGPEIKRTPVRHGCRSPPPHERATHTSSETKSGTDLLKISSVTLTSVQLLSCAV